MAVTDRLGVPVGDELRAFDQNSTPGSERRQRLFGLGDQLLQPCLAPALPSTPTIVALPATASLPVALPTSAGSPSTIEQIVGDLEGLADRRAVALERLALLRRSPRRGCRPRGRRSAAARRSSSPASVRRPSSPSCCGLPPSKRPSAARSSICPPTMPPSPAARASAATSSTRTAGSGCVSRARQNVEGKRQQAVAGEDRGRLVEFLVRGRLPAPQVVIVHRRQIVVHQRIAMHAFERGAGHQRLRGAARRTGAAVSTTRNGRNRLPPPRLDIAHGVHQARRPRLISPAAGVVVKQPIQQVLGILGGRVEARRKGLLFAVHCLSLPGSDCRVYPASGCVYPASILRITEPAGHRQAQTPRRRPTAHVRRTAKWTICDQRAHSVNGAGDLALSPRWGAAASGSAASATTRTAAGQGPWPPVTAVIPARNEAESIGAERQPRCCAQDYPARSR